MKKLLLATVFAASVFGHAHAGEVTENEKLGCLLLGMSAELRIDKIDNWVILCPRLKTIMSDEASCALGTLIARNRTRGVGDLERAPLDVRKKVTKGCIMLMQNTTEQEAQAVVDRLTFPNS